MPPSIATNSQNRSVEVTILSPNSSPFKESREVAGNQSDQFAFTNPQVNLTIKDQSEQM
tara:strand:- start:731 stop:907 length:177 start_codon:yes stop_codon:yes gene_type:complete